MFLPIVYTHTHTQQ